MVKVRKQITDVWETVEELKKDIEIVSKPFEIWHSHNSTGLCDTNYSPEDKALEALCQFNGVELASTKLQLILDNCFDKSTQTGGGWVKG
ncbi:hypothetical protein L0B53_04070 [Vibrio sp. SS-MA-C1-2]|uniref:hypothetical protein n=1 Tax=Vibrio sp. SS-MA-C1-2 TaxID=2908646 RepID=UPI001F24B527|nr:hypothetical protein [Vibrio sp. SS-MA-C1-2]UJF17102.1 hypothetical protein L0B53_04070 [Vibrio sp. SS-MA-C1-2]